MPDLPARQGLERPLIHTRDLEMARLLLAKVYGEFTADIVGQRHPFEWQVNPIEMGPVTLFSDAITSGMRLCGMTTGYTVCLATAGAARAASSGDATGIAPGRRAAVLSPGARSEWSTDGPFRGLNLRVDARYLEAQLEALTGVHIRRPPLFSLAMPTVEGPGTLLERLFRFISTETEHAGRALGHPLVMASLGEAVTRALLFGQPHDHTHLLEKAARPSSRTVVRLVEEYLDAPRERPDRHHRSDHARGREHGLDRRGLPGPSGQQPGGLPSQEAPPPGTGAPAPGRAGRDGGERGPRRRLPARGELRRRVCRGARRDPRRDEAPRARRDRGARRAGGAERRAGPRGRRKR